MKSAITLNVVMARPTGLEPVTYGLAYLLRLSPPLTIVKSQCLGSGLYLHHFRWDTYSLYGSRLFNPYRRHYTLAALRDLAGFLGIAINQVELDLVQNH
jgi:hypothetical protein